MDAVWFYCFKRNKCILIQLQIFFGGLSRLIYEDGYTSKNFLKQKQQWFLSYQQNIYHFPTFLGTTIEIGSQRPLAFNLYNHNQLILTYSLTHSLTHLIKELGLLTSSELFDVVETIWGPWIFWRRWAVVGRKWRWQKLKMRKKVFQ